MSQEWTAESRAFWESCFASALNGYHANGSYDADNGDTQADSCRMAASCADLALYHWRKRFDPSNVDEGRE